jgi:outer membrane lipopolysaccharide assembly protein LptE/RlpB
MTRYVALLLCCTLLCSACGLQLRDDAELPPEMAKTRIVMDNEYGSLGRHLKTLLEQSGVTFVGAADALAFLEIPLDQVVTEVLTIGDNARVREYRISHTVRFRLLDSAGRELLGWQDLRQSREISFDEQKILAGWREDEYHKEDLAATLARIMVTRLEAVPPKQG